MDIKRVLLKIKDVSLSDYISFFPMLTGLLLSPIYKKKYSNTWGICERKDEARDNGYHFFKYMTSNQPQQKCIYTIDKKCNDYQKVKDLGEIVQFGSVKHWILYFTCNYLISSQGFMPNGYICTFLERARLFKPKHVFLQHGITINKPEFLFAKYRSIKYIIAGAEPEYHFLKNEFGYPEGTVKYTGFPRFDCLHGSEIKKNRILVMPTWRKWLKFKSESHKDASINIESSDYAFGWRNLLQSDELQDAIKEYDLEIIFYPHPNMKGILNPVTFVGSSIIIADPNVDDLQELLKTSAMLITDYSSVFFDMTYMKKPVIFYQFDEEKFRKYHYTQGWFDYQKTNFGEVCVTSEKVINIMLDYIKANFILSKRYEAEHEAIFKLYDTRNSERIYKFLL